MNNEIFFEKRLRMGKKITGETHHFTRPIDWNRGGYHVEDCTFIFHCEDFAKRPMERSGAIKNCHFKIVEPEHERN